MDISDRTGYLAKIYKIIGAAMDVYNELGFGFSEPIYQECLSIVCTEKNIPWEREKLLNMYYRGQKHLRITKSFAGLLINFGNPKVLVSERYVYDDFSRNYQYIPFSRH